MTTVFTTIDCNVSTGFSRRFDAFTTSSISLRAFQGDVDFRPSPDTGEHDNFDAQIKLDDRPRNGALELKASWKVVLRFAGVWTHSSESGPVLSSSQRIGLVRPLISWTP